MRTVKIFNITVFLALFINGTNVLASLHWPLTLSPAEIMFFIVFLLYPKGKTSSNKYEYIGIFLIILVLGFNYLTSRQLALAATCTALMQPLLVSVFMKHNFQKCNVKNLKRIVLAFYVIECCLAIAERLLRFHLFPNLGIDSEYIDWNEWRSYSLLGHPLANSGMVLLLMNFILVDRLSVKTKILLWFLGLVALLCFNSRFALVLAVICFGLYGLIIIFSRRGSISKRIIFIVTAIAFAIILQYFFTIGFGDRLVNLGLDDGSSQTRLRALDLFVYSGKTWQDLLFGTTYSDFSSISIASDMSGIVVENFWIQFIFRYGIIFTLLITLVYVRLFYEWFKGYTLLNSFLIIAPWIVNLSSSNSLATGGISITILLIFTYIFKYDSKNNTLLLAKQ